MERKLFKAARTGYLQLLPNGLRDLEQAATVLPDRNVPVWTPFHIACLKGKLRIATEISRTNPGFLRLLNPNGCNALHLASSSDHLHMVDFLLQLAVQAEPQIDQVPGTSVVREICMKKDNEGKTPLHHAVVTGNTEMVQKLLETCPEASLEVTEQGETVFHLAVKSKLQVDADLFMNLLTQGPYTKYILNLADKQGMTVLHLAVLRKQIRIINMLSDPEVNAVNYLDVNAVNSKGQTPLDVLVVNPMNRRDLQIQMIMRRAGGIRLSESKEQREDLKSITSGLFVMASFTITVSCQIAIYLRVNYLQHLQTGNSNTTKDAMQHFSKGEYEAFVYLDHIAFLVSFSIIVTLLIPMPARFSFYKWVTLRLLTYLNVALFFGLIWNLLSNAKNWYDTDFRQVGPLMPFLSIIAILILIPFPLFYSKSWWENPARKQLH